MVEIVVVGLVAAGITFARLLIDIGKALHDEVQKLENAEALVSDLSFFVHVSSPEQLRIQISIGKGLMNDPHVGDGIKTILDENFVDIQTTLVLALKQAEKTVATSRRRRDFFLYRRNRQLLQTSVSSLKRLFTEFGNTIDQLQRQRDGPAATFLPKAAFQVLGPPLVKIVEDVGLRKANLVAELRKTYNAQDTFIVEERKYSLYTKVELEENIKDLSMILASGSRSKGILDLVGYNDVGSEQCFNLIFAVPKTLKFNTTLHHALQTQPAGPLEVRLAICSQLAESVLHVHQLKLVHKNINPFNIAIMQPIDDNTGIQINTDTNVFLLNWRYVRRESDATNKAGESKWWKGIYCHPARQMEFAQDRYNMGHDIYSLGVCILEILLWKTLVDTRSEKPTISPFFKDVAMSMGIYESNRARLLSRGPTTDSEICTEDPPAVQRVLIELARTELPVLAGTRLSSLVASCISCLEGGFPDMSFDATDDPTTGINFIVSIKSELSQISV